MKSSIPTACEWVLLFPLGIATLKKEMTTFELQEEHAKQSLQFKLDMAKGHNSSTTR